MTNKYSVEGMACTGCAAHLEAQLKKTKGILTVSVDFTAKEVTIGLDSDQISNEEILQTAADAGFTLTLIFSA